MILFRFLSLTFLTLFSSLSFAAAPPGESWFTLRTPNFRVHHTGPLEPYARSFAQSLERALPKLETRLKWKLPTPVDVIVMDPSDSANGFAASFPNTHMELYATPFEADSALAYYHNWVDELAIHELTHIVANDGSRGGYSFLRSIFGSWVKPNGLQPVWLMEGLAVYQETSLSPAGRGRSPLFEALLREAVIERKLTHSSYTSIDRFNDGAPWWPAGNTPYLLGYAIQAEANRDAPNLPGEVSFENAGSFPFAVNSVVENLTGTDWPSYWEATRERLEQRFQPRENNQPTCQLTRSGKHTGGHAVGGGWIYYSEEDWNHGFHLARLKEGACPNQEVERLFRKQYSGPTQVAVSQDGKKVAFAAFDRYGNDYFYSDIYLWDAEEEEVERLTDEGRAHAPTFSKDGESIFFIHTKDSVSSIVRMSLKDRSFATIFTAAPTERITSLASSRQNLYFSFHRNQGQEKIYELSLTNPSAKAKEAFQPCKTDRCFERNPFVAADGKIYFAGVYGYSAQDIYVFDPSTKVVTKIFASSTGYADRPVLSQDGKKLFVQEYGLQGLNLVQLDTPTRAQRLEEPQKDLHEFLSGEKRAAKEQDEPMAFSASEEYSAFSSPATSLWPQYWLPEISLEQDGVLAGASTTGNDALNYHNWGLLAQYDSRANFPTYRAFYLNRVFHTELQIEAQQVNDYFSSTKRSNRNAQYSISALVPIGDVNLTLGTAFQERTIFGVKGENFLLFQSLIYSRVGKTPAAIAPNFGTHLQLATGVYPKSRYENIFADIRPIVRLYKSGFHPSHSVSLDARAGITTNSLLASNYYVGGGYSPLSSNRFLVRGYPTDSLLGQRIATVNAAYTLPLAHPYRGWGTNPLFLESLGLRFMADAGTASYLSRYSGNRFIRYQAQDFGKRILTGYGIDFLAQGSIFYHVPASLELGIHYGANKNYGGDFLVSLGLNIGIAGLRNNSNSEPLAPGTGHR